MIAGTCIGSGMIALPLVLAKIGILPSLFLMLLTWALMYYTSLVNLELNLQAGKGMPLGELGRKFSGPIAEWIGMLSLKILSFALLAVFIYGGSSILKELLENKWNASLSFFSIATVYTLAAFLILSLPIRWIDYCNRLLFIGLIGVVALLIFGLAWSIDWSLLPLFSENSSSPSAWMSLIPIVFTSFGFQVIFHTLTNYCQKNASILKQAFFWGSLIPAIVYILWTCSILSVVYADDPAFFQIMADGKAEVGELIQVLSGISKWHSVQLLVWWISLLAIATSVIGVGIGLCESIQGLLPKKLLLRNQAAALTALFPAYVAVLFIPNAFLSVLGFAGMILAVIAILLPVYLFKQLKSHDYHYGELYNKPLLITSFVAGLIVIISELYNML